MNSIHELGKALLVFGGVLMLAGAVCLLAAKLPWLGRLPGDIVIKREHVTFFAPLGTCLLISVLLTVLMWWFGRR